MILTDKDALSNRYIRRKIAQYKQNKADLIASDELIRGVTLRR